MKTYESVQNAAGLPPLNAVEEKLAEELVFLLHEGIDWNVWGGKRLSRYWDALAERVCAATYAGPNIGDWWDDVSRRMSSVPPSSSARLRLTEIIGSSNDTPVLKVLRSKGSMVVLRVRVMLEVYRETKEEGKNG